MAEHETITDIIAEMRGLGNYQQYSGDHARQLADRLKAAHKRERGNAAKLREALKMVCDAHYTKEVDGELYEGFEVEVDDGTGRPLICVVQNALSAPPRNCDRFASAEEAWDAYDEWVESYRAKGEVQPFNEFGWLYAPATEQEGGAK